MNVVCFPELRKVLLYGYYPISIAWESAETSMFQRSGYNFGEQTNPFKVMKAIHVIVLCCYWPKM